MAIVLGPGPDSANEQSSPPETLNPEEGQRHGGEIVVETEIVNEGADTEKHLPTNEEIREKASGVFNTRTVATLLENNASPSALDGFGEEDDEYISGYRLFAALIGIVSVFFIVLLDFSIISTVSILLFRAYHNFQVARLLSSW